MDRKDVEKRRVAKENNLNFKEFWPLDEAKKFIDYIQFNKTKNTEI